MTEGKRKMLVVDDRKVNRQLLFVAFSRKYDVPEAAERAHGPYAGSSGHCRQEKECETQ